MWLGDRVVPHSYPHCCDGRDDDRFHAGCQPLFCPQALDRSGRLGAPGARGAWPRPRRVLLGPARPDHGQRAGPHAARRQDPRRLRRLRRHDQRLLHRRHHPLPQPAEPPRGSAARRRHALVHGRRGPGARAGHLHRRRARGHDPGSRLVRSGAQRRRRGPSHRLDAGVRPLRGRAGPRGPALGADVHAERGAAHASEARVCCTRASTRGPRSPCT